MIVLKEQLQYQNRETAFGTHIPSEMAQYSIIFILSNTDIKTWGICRMSSKVVLRSLPSTKYFNYSLETAHFLQINTGLKLYVILAQTKELYILYFTATENNIEPNLEKIQSFSRGSYRASLR